MFTLETVVPWGRSFDEYRRMFALSDHDLNGRILGCADGPAAFNAEATRRGARVVSCDPLYAFTADEIRGRIAATAHDIIEQTKHNRDEFVWDEITSIEHLRRLRYSVNIERVPYEFQRGGNEMMRIRNHEGTKT
jgi:hypothetical protein